MDKKGRRSKERYVSEAFRLVQQWREYFENGVIDADGNNKKVSLHQAAEMVGVSKKTLEDYHSIIRKVQQISDIEQYMHMKMGSLRSLIKDKKLNNPRQQRVSSQQQQSSIYEHAQQDLEWNNMIIETEDGFFEKPIQYDIEEYNYYPFQDAHTFQFDYEIDYIRDREENFIIENTYERPRSMSRNSAGVIEEEQIINQYMAAPDE